MKRDGTGADVVLLRPDSWLEKNNAKVGGNVYIAVPECGIDGNAKVTNIEACPPIAGGPGQAVIGTFHHHSATVYDLVVEGQDQSIGVTGNHPIWSADRQDYIPAAELSIGERLLAFNGTPRVKSLIPRGPPQPVYNLEVLNHHTYHVTKQGLLVHNANRCPGTSGPSTFPAQPGGTGKAYDEANGQGVYLLRNPKSKQIEYFGRGDAPNRIVEHARPGSGKEDLVGEIIFNNNLPAAKAVSLENELIHMLGGPKSINRSTSLRNKIQSLGEGNPNFIELEFAADDELVIEALRRAGLLGR